MDQTPSLVRRAGPNADIPASLFLIDGDPPDLAALCNLTAVPVVDADDEHRYMLTAVASVLAITDVPALVFVAEAYGAVGDRTIESLGTTYTATLGEVTYGKSFEVVHRPDCGCPSHGEIGNAMARGYLARADRDLPALTPGEAVVLITSPRARIELGFAVPEWSN